MVPQVTWRSEWRVLYLRTSFRAWTCRKLLFRQWILILLMEAFSCDQVSINPVTFTTGPTGVPLWLSAGHVVAGECKIQREGDILSPVWPVFPQNIHVSQLPPSLFYCFTLAGHIFCLPRFIFSPALVFMFRCSFVLHPPTVWTLKIKGYT